MPGRNFSLATLLFLVTACGGLSGIILVYVRPDHQGLAWTWGGWVALLLLSANGVIRQPQSDRNKMGRWATNMTIAAGVVPCSCLLLFLLTEIAGPGPFVEFMEFFWVPLLVAGVPVAIFVILFAMILQAFDEFSLSLVATQVVALCATPWPYVYSGTFW